MARFADRIAYVNHDLDDAIRAGILDPGEAPKAVATKLGFSHSERIDTLVSDLVQTSEDREEISLSPTLLPVLDELRAFLFDHVYLRSEAHQEQEKAVLLVRALFAYYLENPKAIPAEITRTPGDLATHVADYIAGMTDRFALRTYERLFLPQKWLL